MATKKTLTDHLADIMAEVGYVQKDARNDHFKYKYASADAVMTKVRAACAARGIGIIQSHAELVDFTGGLATVRITQVYAKGAGDAQETARFQGLGQGKDSGDKAVMKANTAALKYLLANAFNISWGDDPEATQGDASATSKPKRAAAKRSKPAKAAPSVADLTKKIAEAKVAADLDAVRNTMLKTLDKSSEDFAKLRAAVVARRAELTG